MFALRLLFLRLQRTTVASSALALESSCQWQWSDFDKRVASIVSVDGAAGWVTRVPASRAGRSPAGFAHAGLVPSPAGKAAWT